jgi:hypothetical protein
MLVAQKRLNKPGVVVYACNPRIRSLRQEALKFEGSLGYPVRPCIQTKKAKNKQKS